MKAILVLLFVIGCGSPDLCPEPQQCADRCCSAGQQCVAISEGHGTCAPVSH